MQWVFGAMAVLALVLAGLDMLISWVRHDELEHRVNVIDEVVTVLSEEIDELQRVLRSAQDARREAPLTDGERRVKELEAMGKNVEIKTSKGSE